MLSLRKCVASRHPLRNQTKIGTTLKI